MKVNVGALYLGRDTDDASPLPFEELEWTVSLEANAEANDNDCDGIINSVDPLPDGLPPPTLIALVSETQRVIEGAEVTFLVDARDPNGAIDAISWEVPEGLIGARAENRAGGYVVFADLPGAYQVRAKAANATGEAEVVFELIVDPEPILNTPPRCGLTASAVSVFSGDAIELNAFLDDDESIEQDLSNTWLIPGGVIAGASEGLETSAEFPEPGDYPIGCFPFDGTDYGEPSYIVVSVVERPVNTPPILSGYHH